MQLNSKPVRVGDIIGSPVICHTACARPLEPLVFEAMKLAYCRSF